MWRLAFLLKNASFFVLLFLSWLPISCCFWHRREQRNRLACHGRNNINSYWCKYVTEQTKGLSSLSLHIRPIKRHYKKYKKKNMFSIIFPLLSGLFVSKHCVKTSLFFSQQCPYCVKPVLCHWKKWIFTNIQVQIVLLRCLMQLTKIFFISKSSLWNYEWRSYHL